MIQMDNRLERYERVQDAELETYLKEDVNELLGRLREGFNQSLGFWREQRILLMREIDRIEKHLANNECDEYVNPRAWRERLADCRTQLGVVEAQLREMEVS